MAEGTESSAPTKLQSRAWSTGTLHQGMAVIEAQQVKTEDDPDVLQMEQELQDMLMLSLREYIGPAIPSPT